MTALSVTTLAPELARLAEVYARPKHWPTEAASLARMFLGPMSAPPAPSVEQVAAAVTAYLASDAPYFPKPGSLRVLATKQQRMAIVGADDLPVRYKAWDYSDDAVSGRTACPVCAARWGDQLVGINPDGSPRYRWECWHDHDLHMRAGVDYVGRLRTPVERERLTAKLDAEQRVADEVAAGRLQILRSGRVVPVNPKPAPAA